MPDTALMALFESCSKAVVELMRKRAVVLEEQQDANAQLALALTPYLQQQDMPEPASTEDVARQLAEQRELAQRAFARAGALDPAHPDVAWLAANHCFEGKQCNAVQQALQSREPDNLATWLMAMGWARRQKDQAAIDAAFHRAVAATRYDTHRGAGMLAIAEAYAGLPTPAVCKNARLQDWMRKQLPGRGRIDAETFVDMMALAGEQASVFAGVELRDQCTPGSGEVLTPERQAGCVHIYEAMAGGSTEVEQILAATQLIELTRDAPNATKWRERYRQLRWMMEQRRGNATPLDLLDIGTNEVGAMQAALQAQGRWPAPAGWLPDDERARSLIQTGRPPPESRR